MKSSLQKTKLGAPAAASRSQTALVWFGLVASVAIYSIVAYHYQFVQDDAFISYRYVMNFLNGDGLVWNIGERIEGFTNFGWVIILALVGNLGLDIFSVSRWLGFSCGVGIIVTSWMIARLIFTDSSRNAVVLSTLIVGATGALAYWSQAGLETAAFGLMASLSLYFYLTKNWMLIWSLLMAVWLRPDGAVIAFALLVAEATSERRVPWFTLLSGMTALVLTLPMIGFKWMYYHSLAPNSFYAKTATDFAQVLNGLSYSWEFLQHYGFWGVGLLASLILYRSLDSTLRAVLIFVIVYGLYIVVIGGDVLKVHRFFMPLVGTFACLTAMVARVLTSKLNRKLQLAVWVVLIVGLPAFTWWQPRRVIEAFLQNERDLVTKMTEAGETLKQLDKSNFSLAASTIGAIGYSLQGHRVIDMLGLTDSTIARHPERPSSELASTWKERRFNSPYLLSQAPDYVLFSTGIKPSAPAEKALFLYRQWDRCYRAIPWLNPYDAASGNYKPRYVFRRVRTPLPPFQPSYANEMVEKLSDALQSASINDPLVGYDKLETVRKYLRGERNMFIDYWQAVMLSEMGRQDESLARMNELLKIDSLIPGAHRDLYLFARVDREVEKAAIHRAYLERLSPVDLIAADEHLRKIGIQ